MTSVLRLIPLACALLFQPTYATAADDPALRKQRLEAQRDRQQQVNERNRQHNDGIRAFRTLAQDLKRGYQEQLRSLDTEFELRQVDINADHTASIESAQADHQSKIMGLYMNPGAENAPQSPAQLGAELKAHAEKIFSLKKQYAEALHAEAIEKEKRKNTLLTEMDRQALEEAEALGLTAELSPVLASPIGGELTLQEERWNEREAKAVARLEEQNRKTLGEFRNGARLRQWEIDNLDEDFRLTWEEKEKVHALEVEQAVFNPLLTGAAQAGEAGAFDPQQMMAKMKELGDKKRLINTEYRKIREKNRIERREQRKAILAE